MQLMLFNYKLMEPWCNWEQLKIQPQLHLQLLPNLQLLPQLNLIHVHLIKLELELKLMDVTIPQTSQSLKMLLSIEFISAILQLTQHMLLKYLPLTLIAVNIKLTLWTVHLTQRFKPGLLKQEDHPQPSQLPKLPMPCLKPLPSKWTEKLFKIWLFSLERVIILYSEIYIREIYII